jgi:hypothetical protein
MHSVFGKQALVAIAPDPQDGSLEDFREGVDLVQRTPPLTALL